MKKILALLLLTALPAPAQVIMEEVGTLSEQLDKAGDQFRSYKFEKSVQTLSTLISTLDDWEKNGSLQESDEAVYKKALEIRAVSYFHLGREQNAREDFSRLVKLDPDVSPEITSSSKILRFFNTVRDSMAGSLVLTVTPHDAEITIDGKAFAGSRTIRLLEGLHILKASAMGHNSFTREILVAAGKSVEESISLKPNARKVFFFIRPQGAKLFVDGRLAGSADVAASEKPEWSQYISGTGNDPGEFFAIEALYLPPGDHRIEISAPCHATRKFTIPVSLDAVENKPGYIKPLELQMETLTLMVDSHPRSAVVEIDGTKYGSTPVEIRDFCSGSHTVRVFKEGQGEYSQKLELRGVRSYRLNAKLRPTLLWLGSSMDQEVSREAGSLFQESMSSALSNIESFNLVLSKEENPFLSDTFFTRGVSAAEQESAVKQLCSKYRCEGLLVSKLSSEGENVVASLRLYVPGISGFDETTALLLDAREPSFLVKKFDPAKDVALSGPLFFSDGGEGVVVLRAGGCWNGIAPGDRITSIEGEAQKTPVEAAKWFTGSGKKLAVVYSRGPEVRSAEILDAQPVFFCDGDGAGSRKQWLRFNQEVISSEEEFPLAAAKLSLASVEIGLGRPLVALDILDGLQLAEQSACLVPTRKYLRAVALFHLGRLDEAKEELAALKALPEGTRLGSDGKVLLLPLVEDLLKMTGDGERR
ncbi:MAG TPA: PEGA domain-containing protein [Acidobacteriota bacterium]|nr:PEGA domain-containing protein [Acidobacteriota bacterium]HNT17427.1 PEGA domain-containing protein [Acidobacteriota bacterium]HPA26216.1 PEGA domain-containing protein [Acidobacteriota bacterium]HQO18775.1 PEGA domain-containing protein [Acidobacteriota bacterium]HQQ46664.1 PEGA domain-containing protein [Acidobacteriota bacterium]